MKIAPCNVNRINGCLARPRVCAAAPVELGR